MATQVFESLGVAVGASSTVLVDRYPAGRNSTFNVEVQNTGGSNAFTDFVIQIKDHPAGEWYDFFTAADIAAFIAGTSDPDCLHDCSDALGTLANSSVGHIIFTVHAAWGVRIKATAASGTTAAVRGTTYLKGV